MPDLACGLNISHSETGKQEIEKSAALLTNSLIFPGLLRCSPHVKTPNASS